MQRVSSLLEIFKTKVGAVNASQQFHSLSPKIARLAAVEEHVRLLVVLRILRTENLSVAIGLTVGQNVPTL